MNTHTIPVVLGTAREDRQSERAAQLIVDTLESHEEVNVSLVDVRDHVSNAVTIPPWGKGGAEETPTKWQSIVKESDALILVVPEYNHGYPGELKILLDSLYDEYVGKPVLLAGVSGGGWGGTRVVDHIKPVLIELGLTVPKKAVLYFPKIKDEFDDGAGERITRAVEELRSYIR